MKHALFNRSALLLFALLAACGTTPKTTPSGKRASHELPENAKLFIKTPGHDQLGGMSEACSSFSLNESQVREMFKTYRKISKAEVQQKYAVAPCYVEGLIETPKQVYSWRFRAGNIIETNFPAGKETLLGGEPTKTKTSVR